MESRTPKLVFFGNGTDVVYCTGGSILSGYGSPDSPHASAESIPNGTVAIDKRAAVETDAGYRLAINGPMVGIDLGPDQIDRCPQPSALMSEAMSSHGNEYGTLLALQNLSKAADPAKPGPMDKVSIPAYVELWRSVGARIGRYADNAIVWE
jgi:hypothetical protein